jgi:hypothetical protein
MDFPFEPETLQVQDNIPPQVGGRRRDPENNDTCRKKTFSITLSFTKSSV